MLEGMHHVAVSASEEARTLDFYVNKLGFTGNKSGGRQPRDYLRMLRLRIWCWSCSSSPTLLPG